MHSHSRRFALTGPLLRRSGAAMRPPPLGSALDNTPPPIQAASHLHDAATSLLRVRWSSSSDLTDASRFELNPTSGVHSSPPPRPIRAPTATSKGHCRLRPHLRSPRASFHQNAATKLPPLSSLTSDLFLQASATTNSYPNPDLNQGPHSAAAVTPSSFPAAAQASSSACTALSAGPTTSPPVKQRTSKEPETPQPNKSDPPDLSPLILARTGIGTSAGTVIMDLTWNQRLKTEKSQGEPPQSQPQQAQSQPRQAPGKSG